MVKEEGLKKKKKKNIPSLLKRTCLHDKIEKENVTKQKTRRSKKMALAFYISFYD